MRFPDELPFRFAVASFASAMLSFWTLSWFARSQAPAELVSLAILSIVVSMSTVRSMERGMRLFGRWWLDALLKLVLVGIVALLAGLIQHLVHVSAALGFAIIAVPLVLAVWLRRFGPSWSRAGALLSFPFVAVLITPVAAVGHTGTPWGTGVWWTGLAGVIAVAWASLLGWLAAAPGAIRVESARAVALAAAVPEPARPASSRRRLPASTRMALHLALSFAAAIVVGQLIDPNHLGWYVLTVYVVTAGNRGRVDVIYKGIQRVVGAACGTALAALVSVLFTPGDSATVVTIFVVLGCGAVLRVIDYAFWAMAMTGALALLYRFDALDAGSSEATALAHRLLAIVIAGCLAILASCLILPIRSIDVVRKRSGAAIHAAAELLRTSKEDASAIASARQVVSHRIAEVTQLAPSLRMLRRAGGVVRVSAATRPADLVDAVQALSTLVDAFAAERTREHAGQLKQGIDRVMALIHPESVGSAPDSIAHPQQ